MKLKLLGLILFALFISCQSEVIDNREDWIEEIDKTIEDYDKTEKIANSLTKSHKKFVGEITQSIFNENDQRVHKIIFQNNVLGFNVKKEIYMRDNKIIFYSRKGYSLSIQKHQDNEQKLFLSHKKVYFKSINEAYVYEKKVYSPDFNLKDSYDCLDNMKFNEKIIENPEEEYKQTIETVEEISKELK